MNVAALQEKASSASELLKVLANETRLLILCQLFEGEKPVNELEELVGIRQSALSQHLAILRRERLVTTRRQAQFIYYSVASEEASILLGALHKIYCEPRKKTRQAARRTAETV
jgi:DNA-binding transcriptional ArsR family regulator